MYFVVTNVPRNNWHQVLSFYFKSCFLTCIYYCLLLQSAEIIFPHCHQAALYSHASTKIYLSTFHLSSRKLYGPFIIYG